MSEITRKDYETSHGNIAYWVTENIDPTRPFLVFLPGLTLDARLFAEQISHFRGSTNILVWDGPAHGKSRPFKLGFSLEEAADWLVAILTREKFTNPVLIGQSFGSYVSQTVLRRHPRLARGFISIDAAPVQHRYYTNFELWQLRNTRVPLQLIPWPVLRWLTARSGSYTRAGRKAVNEITGSYSKQDFVRISAHGYRIFGTATASNFDFTLPCPTLLICGVEDRFASVKNYNRRWAETANLPIVWVPNAGHNANSDNPAVVNRAIAEFVEFLPHD